MTPPRSPGHLVTLGLVLILTAQLSADDCNGNGIDDLCDISCGESGGACDLPGCGASPDCNANTVPDECEMIPSLLHPALLHRYSFDSDASDSVGGANGTLFNGATVSNGSLQLDGTDDHAELPVSATIANLTNATIEAWIVYNGGGDWQRVFDCGTSTSNYMFLTPKVGGVPRFAIRTQTVTEEQLTSPANILTGVTTHLAVTIDATGNVGKIYVNGQPMDTNNAMTLNPSDLGTATTMYLGKSFWPDPFFNGSISEFRIYGATLSEADILASYNSGPDAAGPPANDCNVNGVLDECDIASETSQDCNENDIPDECDIAGGTSQDANSNGIPDECETADCNENGINDLCDIACGPSGGPCDIPGCGTSSDCNDNHIPDECELAVGDPNIFPDMLVENTTGVSDTAYLGPPDDTYGSLVNNRVTYDFGATSIIDGTGADFTVYEVDWGVAEFDSIDVLISLNGTDFISVKASETTVVRIPGDEAHGSNTFARSYDLAGSGLASARYVRIQGQNVTIGNGFDLDAIGAIHVQALSPTDCNGNGVLDECDLAAGTSQDCNANQIPDECDIASGRSDDCNTNEIPDECELTSGEPDVFPNVLIENTTGVSDATYLGPPDDTYGGLANNRVTYDYGTTSIIDGAGADFTVYEVDWGGIEFDNIDVLISADGTNFISVKASETTAVRIPGDEAHNNNTFARSYDLAGSGLASARYVRIQGQNVTSGNGFDLDAMGAIHVQAPSATDCNDNGVLDECDLAAGTSQDCNANQVPDECDIADQTSGDCNLNEIPDECDIAGGTSRDCNTNGIPDECEATSPLIHPHLVHRYSFTANAKDSIGNANGQLLNGATISDGKVVFDGIDDYVVLPIAGTLTNLSRGTIELWMSRGSGNNMHAYTFGTNAANQMFFTPLGGDVAKFIAQQATVLQTLAAPSYLPVNVLKHVAVTIDSASNTGRLYIDGNLVDENTELTFGFSVIGPTPIAWLGRSLHEIEPYLKGAISEFRIYNDVLVGTEILTSYTAGPDAIVNNDADNDGVLTECDLCPGTVPGSPVDGNGCPPIIPFDFNRDGDVDEEDRLVAASCDSGPAVPHDGSTTCQSADIDNDQDVDQDDFGVFQRCYSGTDVPGNADCAN